MQKAIFVIRQWATRLVYTQGFFRGCYKAFSAVRASLRGIARTVRRPFTRRDQGAAAAPGDPLRHFKRYQQEFADLPGWFHPRAQAAWDCLLCFQARQGLRGNLLEIGVWRGKSAACSALHARQDETCVFVDPLLLAEFKDTIKSIRSSNNRFLEISSESLSELPEIMQLASTFRWIHIDGEHSGESVRRDLTVAQILLADRGMICVDDFPSCAYPQVNFAVNEFLHQRPELSMVACGHNKGYICGRESAMEYLVFIRDELHREMTARGASVTIWKSGRPTDWKCFGITDRVEMFDYRGPDWNPRKIEI